MLTVGVALFATFSGFLANLFLSASNEAPADKPADPESGLRATLEHVERLHLEQQVALDELRAHIAVLKGS